MRFTGRTLYVSGQVTTFDIATDNNTDPATYASGLIPIYSNERRNYGYIVKHFGPFPSVSATDSGVSKMILTTYSARDCKRLRDGGASGGNQTLRIIGAQAGIAPASNDRVLATFTDISGVSIHDGGIVKKDALFVQELSLGIDGPRDSVSYYVEFDEYELTDDEMVLALLQESDQNVGNFDVAAQLP